MKSLVAQPKRNREVRERLWKRVQEHTGPAPKVLPKGEKLPEEVVKGGKLTFAGDKHTVKVGKDTIIGTQKLDPTKNPKEIDATDTEGPFKGKTTQGIYKLDGDMFTVCFAPPGKDRPKEFTSKSSTSGKSTRSKSTSPVRSSNARAM